MTDIKTTRVFISYSSANKDIAFNMCDFLEKNGKTCWIAPRNIPAGTEYGEAIINGIESSNVFVLVFSEASNKSQHVLREVERAVSKNIPIISYRLDNSELSKSMEYFLLTNQWLDTSSGKEKMLGKLNSSIDVISNAKSDKPENSSDEFTSSKKAGIAFVPFILGIIAVGIIAIAIILGLSLGFLKGSDDTSSLPDTSSETAALTSEPSETEATTATETTPAAETTPVFETSSSAQTTETLPAETTAVPITSNAITTETAEAPVFPEIEAGDYISYGRYYPTGYSEANGDGELRWQILAYDKENNTATLITEKIIDIKPFDCAESGIFDEAVDGATYDRSKADEYTAEQMMEFRGSNDWASSDIRAWLNKSGKVKYSSVSQSDAATDEYGNGFTNQKGFLTSFTDAEFGAIVPIKLPEGTNDFVYLLSLSEVKQYIETSFFDAHSGITKSAIASDETSWYNTYAASNAEDYIWATRTPYEDNSHQIYIIDSIAAHELYTPKNAASSGLGIRPVINVQLDRFNITGDGSATNPFTIER